MLAKWFKKFSLFDESRPTIATDNTTFDLSLELQKSQFNRMMKLADRYDRGLISFEDLKLKLDDITKGRDMRIIRFPFACIGFLIGFIVGYGAWLFCLGMGPMMLLTHIIYWPLVYAGIFKDDSIDYSDAWFHLVGFLLGASTFKQIMDGKFPQ